MRSYGQYCAVAKALDVIGDRWNLLVVRELLLRGRCRYTDLLHGLPGIASNLLADRLRDLEQAGVVCREDAPPPVATTLFRLTARGEELKPVVIELARWGVPLMIEHGENDAFCGHWVAVLAELYPTDRSPSGPPVTIELSTGGQSTTIEIADGEVHARPGAAEHADLRLTGPGQLILAVMTAKLDLQRAHARGLQHQGNPDVLLRLRPAAAPQESSEGVSSSYATR